jgi:hypothetical protein
MNCHPERVLVRTCTKTSRRTRISVSSIRPSPLRVPKPTKIRKINEFLTTRISLPHLADHSYPFAHNQPKLQISAHHLLRPLSAICCLLSASAVCCSLFAVYCLLLAVSYRLQATGYWLSATGHRQLLINQSIWGRNSLIPAILDFKSLILNALACLLESKSH